MPGQTNDESRSETSKKRLTALILPVLGACWVAFLLFPDYLGQESTVNYAAMTLGVGLMFAGAFRFLYSSSDETDQAESSDTSESGDATESNE